MKKIALISAVLLLSISSHSQERRLALVIGNGNYDMSILANPENDARSMEKALKSIGFEVLKYENLKQKQMTRAIDDFGNRLTKYDVGLFFFAGHGIQANGFNYLIPVDASLKSESDVEYNCVRADRVLGKMEDAKNRVNFVILDACRDNPFERSWTRTAKGRGLATMNAPVGSVIAFATSPGNTASDGAGDNGLYTSGILKFLPEPGLTAIQMFQNVTGHVQEVSNGTQLPWVSTSLTGDVYFVEGSSGVSNPVASGSQLTRERIDENIAVRSNLEISIAVLPFSNYTGNDEQEWLVACQHETLITELSKISQFRPLRVIYRGSVNSIRNYNMSISEIARVIDVDFVVEGSVISYSDSVMLQLRLIQALPDEKLVWAESFTSDVPNILRLHSAIAEQITHNMNLDLSEEEKNRLPKPRKINPEAYAAYLRGMGQLNQLTPESFKKGIEYMHEAIRIDPAEPFAYAGLALGYLEMAHSMLDPGNSLPKAEAAALQALKLDSTMAITHAALAEVYLYFLWNFKKANVHFQKALELDPNLAITHYHYAWALYLYGDMEGAIREHKLAKKYDPFNPLHAAYLGTLYCFDGQYEAAIKEAKEAMEFEKDYGPSYWTLGVAYLGQGKNEEAIEAHKKLGPWWTWPLGLTYVKTGQIEEAKKLLEDLKKLEIDPWNAFQLAVFHAALGNNDEAFRWINYKPAHSFVPFVAVLPEFNNLHDDPRFKEFVEKLNLAE